MLEENATLCIAGSDYGEHQARSAFHYKGEIMKLGYPRNDILIRNDEAEKKAIREKLGISEDTMLLMYAPTFRDTELRAAKTQRMPLDLYHVLDKLEETTGKQWKCLVRAHYQSFGLPLDDGSGRLLMMTDYPEMAELLLVSDALLTDYSSCAGDYALMRRPIWLYQDDIDDYTGNNRGLYFNMEDSPYWVASTPDEMDQLIRDCTPERAKENCDAILEFYGEAETGHAAESIAKYIIEKLEAYQAKAGKR
jgi:CDP-glycerol glycerophosphotransferase